MKSDTSKIDQILQYALLLAGDEDGFYDRQLGPIHLIKYVYLADLFYAKRNQGETYTGVDWKFYKFGPWAQTVNERIEPALSGIFAESKTSPSNYADKDDWVRWWIQDEQKLARIERDIPRPIKLKLKTEIHKYKQDTPSLLDYVYRTKPMLDAAPNEYLDFSLVVEGEPAPSVGTESLKLDKLSDKKKKKFKEKMNALHEIQKNRKSKERVLVNLVKKPRYDDIYSDGVTWLDGLAGPEFSLGEKEVEFSEEVWKSPARKGEDVS